MVPADDGRPYQVRIDEVDEPGHEGKTRKKCDGNGGGETDDHNNKSRIEGRQHMVKGRSKPQLMGYRERGEGAIHTHIGT
jgi:hypothetical protein